MEHLAGYGSDSSSGSEDQRDAKKPRTTLLRKPGVNAAPSTSLAATFSADFVPTTQARKSKHATQHTHTHSIIHVYMLFMLIVNGRVVDVVCLK